jgi:hypothetical protein
LASYVERQGSRHTAIKVAETLRKRYGLKHVILEADTPSFKLGVAHARKIVDGMFDMAVERLRDIGFKGEAITVEEMWTLYNSVTDGRERNELPAILKGVDVI